MHFGIIGCGKMGQALLKGALNANVFPPANVLVHDKFQLAVDQVTAELGVTAAASNLDVVQRADTILLAVKPQDMIPMLETCREVAAGKLFISIAAGIKIDAMETALGLANQTAPPGASASPATDPPGASASPATDPPASPTSLRPARIVRVMPNTPALVGKGASAYALGSSATEDDAALVERILCAVGIVVPVPEAHLDTVTALSGSGPAYIFAMIESMIAGAVDQGLDESIALDLAVQTVAGAAELVTRTGESPTTLRENVTSPNGTTFAALESMRADGFDTLVRNAIRAATERSVELGGGLRPPVIG